MRIFSSELLLIAASSLMLHDMVLAQDSETTPIVEQKVCNLIGKIPPAKTKPALSYCFRNNVQGACCLTSHDTLMREKWDSFMPEMCNQMYPEFE